jgi:hypothetical protein
MCRHTDEIKTALTEHQRLFIFEEKAGCVTLYNIPYTCKIRPYGSSYRVLIYRGIGRRVFDEETHFTHNLASFLATHPMFADDNKIMEEAKAVMRLYGLRDFKNAPTSLSRRLERLMNQATDDDTLDKMIQMEDHLNLLKAAQRITDTL